MPDNAPVTRDRLARELALNAATKPLNLAALFGLAAVGFAAGIPLLAGVVALAIYAVLCVLTFLDGGEAERVGREAYARDRRGRAALDPAALPPRIGGPLRTALEQAGGIRAAIATSGGAMDDVAGDVDALVGAMEASARRAATLATTLDELTASGADPETLERRAADLRRREPAPDVTALIADLEAQRAATIRLQGKLERFEVGQERICASLGTLRARIAEMSAAEEEAAQRELTAAARDLRERTDLLAESLAEVFAEDDAGSGERLHAADDPRSVSRGT